MLIDMCLAKFDIYQGTKLQIVLTLFRQIQFLRFFENTRSTDKNVKNQLYAFLRSIYH